MKNEIIIFDTETTGLPTWGEPSGGENQPHIVQLAALRVDVDTRKIMQSMDVIIQPNGWTIPYETIEIHGITTEYAMDVGVPELIALELFLHLWNGRKRIAFNTTFDNRIIRIGTKRYAEPEVIDTWKAGEYECAMMKAQKMMSVKSVGLTEAYQHFVGKERKNAHSAMGDAVGCMELYFAMLDQQKEIA